MKRRLQITMKAEHLTKRITDGIAERQRKLAILDGRIDARAGDQPYDIRADDGLDSLEELQTERERLRDRITQLELVRDSIIGGDTYVMSRADLRTTGLLSDLSADEPLALEGDWAECHSGCPVDGLKLTFKGADIRALLDERRRVHDARALSWRHEATRAPEDRTEDAPLLPDQMCVNEAESEEWRATLIAFIRNHIEPDETYRLGADDLDFGDLLPEKPAAMQQEEDEERTGVAFGLECLARKM